LHGIGDLARWSRAADGPITGSQSEGRGDKRGGAMPLEALRKSGRLL
jgi:hypothetical protein